MARRAEKAPRLAVWGTDPDLEVMMVVVGEIPGRCVPGGRDDVPRVRSLDERLRLAAAVGRCPLEAAGSGEGHPVAPGRPDRKPSAEQRFPRAVLKIDHLYPAGNIEHRAAAIWRHVQVAVIETLALHAGRPA